MTFGFSWALRRTGASASRRKSFFMEESFSNPECFVQLFRNLLDPIVDKPGRMEILRTGTLEAIKARFGGKGAADDPENDRGKDDGCSKGHHASVSTHSEERESGCEQDPKHDDGHPWREFSEKSPGSSGANFQSKANIVFVTATFTVLRKAHRPLWSQ